MLALAKSEEYCQKLIIQINGIIKKLPLINLIFIVKKIAQITKDTLAKFNKINTQ